MKGGGSGVQGHPGVHRELKARPCLGGCLSGILVVTLIVNARDLGPDVMLAQKELWRKALLAREATCWPGVVALVALVSAMLPVVWAC